MIQRLAWVTAREARGGDEDEALGLAALGRTGVAVEVVDWDDPEVDWSSFDRIALRSTWDYTDRLPEFLAWIERVDVVSELVNPPAMVRWNLDKRYLGELAAAGVPITPTAFVPPGTSPGFPAGEFVVKPATGAGSREVAAYRPDQHDLALAHVARLHASGLVVLVQPLLASVATEGEWPLVYFDGLFSHAASKRVALPQAGVIDELYAAETNAPHVATPAQLDVAQAAMEVVRGRFGTPAYARIDLVRAEDGGYCVLEVELIEPSLFLPYAEPGAADRLAAALIGGPPAFGAESPTPKRSP